MSKYKSKKITVDGYTSDSIDEYRYYEYLLDKKSKREILNFELQPKYTLVPGFKKDGKMQRAVTYAPDFRIYHLDGSEELIDVKGYSTQQGELRKKLFDYLKPILRIISEDKEKLAGNDMIHYRCLLKIDDLPKVIEIKYEVDTCRWILNKM